MVKDQVRLSRPNITKILENVIPAHYKQYPILKQQAEQTKPHTVDDGVAWLLRFWEKNW